MISKKLYCPTCRARAVIRFRWIRQMTRGGRPIRVKRRYLYCRRCRTGFRVQRVRVPQST